MRKGAAPSCLACGILAPLHGWLGPADIFCDVSSDAFSFSSFWLADFLFYRFVRGGGASSSIGFRADRSAGPRRRFGAGLLGDGGFVCGGGGEDYSAGDGASAAGRKFAAGGGREWRARVGVAGGGEGDGLGGGGGLRRGR